MNLPQRTPEQLRNHYEVEKELATRLSRSTREERKTIYGVLYNELFARVPDHPRLTCRESPEEVERSVRARLPLLKEHLRSDQTVVEFAPGDCRLAFRLCPLVKEVIGIDISDQSGGTVTPPSNFRLIVYDGYSLDLPAESADVVFSYQFLEHLHPDDVELHFEIVHRLLKPGGRYVFATPHRFSGPHDISRHFSDTPEGFHLHEWTYHEMRDVLRHAGFSGAHTYRFGKCRRSLFVTAATYALESLFGLLPVKLRRKVSARLFESVTMVAYK